MHGCLVLFDIDGTLTDADGAGLEAIRLAARDLYGSRGVLPELDVRGATDAALAREVLPAFGVDCTASRIKELYDAYLFRLREQLDEPRPQAMVLPGVRRLLDLLTEGGAVLGLLTGNLEAGAWLKLQRFGVDHYFSFGAFGDEHAERNKLGPEALARAEEVQNHSFSPSRTVIVGDTPRDVSCGQAIGALTIAVATGSFSLEQLSACNPTLAVRSLEDSSRIVGLLKNCSEGRGEACTGSKSPA